MANERSGAQQPSGSRISRGEAIRRLAGLGLATVGGADLLIATLTPRTVYAESSFEGPKGVPSQVNVEPRTKIFELDSSNGFVRENTGNAYATKLPDVPIQVEDGAVVKMEEVGEGQTVIIGNPDKSNTARFSLVTVEVPADSMLFVTGGFGRQEFPDCGIVWNSDKRDGAEFKRFTRNRMADACNTGCPPVDNAYTTLLKDGPSGDVRFQYWKLSSTDIMGKLRRSQMKQYEESARKGGIVDLSIQFLDKPVGEYLMLEAKPQAGTVAFDRTNAPRG